MPRRKRRETLDHEMHDPDQGFLYFVAGVVSWRPAGDGSPRWSVRVDVVLHPPSHFIAADAGAALQLAQTLASGFESAMSHDLEAVGVSADGRTLRGSLPARQQPHNPEPEHRSGERRAAQ